MAIASDQCTPNSTTSIHDIMIKANDNRLQEWMTPLVGAFESTVEICTLYKERQAAALQNPHKICHFSL